MSFSLAKMIPRLLISSVIIDGFERRLSTWGACPQLVDFRYHVRTKRKGEQTSYEDESEAKMQ